MIKMKNTVKVIWLATAIVILVLTIINYDGKPNSDIEEFLLWTMAAIGFPTSLLGGALILGVAYIWEKALTYSVTASLPWLVFEWLVFVVTGYVQWFYLLPKLWRRFKHPESHLSESPSGRVAPR
jgi:hypothetical protein